MKKLLLLAVLLSPVAEAQDSVDVTFRYLPKSGSPGMVFLPGEFNNWGPNNNGIIPLNSPSLMVRDPLAGVWTKTVRLQIGYSKVILGAYQYKFNEDGSKWLADPLNPRTNPNDNGNSYLYVTNPTIYQFIPNQVTGVVKTANPVVSAYIYPKVGTTLDTAALSIKVDSKEYGGLGRYYNPSTQKLSFRVSDPLKNGAHKIWLRAGTVTDSVSIIVQSGITNVGDFTTRNPQRVLYGVVEDTSIHVVRLVRNDVDTFVVAVSIGRYAATITLIEGTNTFKAVTRDTSNSVQVSDPVTYTYFVNHAPTAAITFLPTPSQVVLSAATSTDPDSGQASQLSYQWAVDPNNPETSSIATSDRQETITIIKPKTPGDYFFSLIVSDPSGNKDTTRSFFSILDDGAFQNSSLASVPRWVKQGRVYELFFKSLTPQGTINAALPYLLYFKSLGISILWVMPVMENAAPMNNASGTGYNIKNFLKVAPEYGTNEDFKNFVKEAHRAGLKVVLDVTPNHTSYQHPFVLHAKQYREDSPYWSFYQHTIIPHNENGVGPQRVDAEGFVYYDGFSSQLLNYNWSDIDARTYMTEVYKSWVKGFDIDGFRLDVYWGPRRRANDGAGGENEMGVPVRQALKHIKPDILLLAEDAGTGVGTESIYGDRAGGVDAGYDWQLFWEGIRPVYSRGADNLNTYVTNFGGTKMGFIPGPNAAFLRFLENHDEDRIVYVYGAYEKTMPIATVVMTAPGLPMIYSGQEVGYGLGLGGFDQRRRGVIDWNTPGKSLLMPHYQRLAQIRQQFNAFTTQTMFRLSTDNPSVYAFTRPYPRGNAVTLVNLSDTRQNVKLYLNQTNMDTTACKCEDHYGNDLYSDTTVVVPFIDGQLILSYSLKPYGSAVFVVSDTIKRLVLPALTSVQDRNGAIVRTTTFRLHQNYPNPFNPSTTISYELSAESQVSLKVYNLLGEEVAALVDERQREGLYAVQWNGATSGGVMRSSGVYFVRFEAGGFVEVKRMILLK